MHTSLFRKNALLFFILLCAQLSFAQKFAVSFSSKTARGNFTGNIYVFLSKSEKEPLFGANFPVAAPVIRLHVKNVKADSVVVISDQNSGSYPISPSLLERGDYYVQAVFDRDNGFTVDRAVSETAGNLYSHSQKISFSHDLSRKYRIVCDNRMPDKKFTETDQTKEFVIRSKLLSQFHHKDIFLKGAVVLPDTLLKNPAASLPVYVYIAGFGGNYMSLNGNQRPASDFTNEKDFIYVFLDGNCTNGHSVYANSDNNGPWGDALVYEVLPAIEKKYHCNGYRYVHGHSSGGWASLYLQVMYPDFFHACWASSPDSYDFRNFSGINLYDPGTNVYYDSTGSLRPAALLGGFLPIAYIKPLAAWENIVRGEQFNSFNAVFSGRSASGAFKSLWDPVTGAVRPDVVKEWQRYDLSLYLREHWSRLEPALSGKIYITVGESDNFLLDGANRLFRDDAAKMKMDIRVKFFSGDHFTVVTDQVEEEARGILDKNYSAWKLKHQTNTYAGGQ